MSVFDNVVHLELGQSLSYTHLFESRLRITYVKLTGIARVPVKVTETVASLSLSATESVDVANPTVKTTNRSSKTASLWIQKWNNFYFAPVPQSKKHLT